MPLVFVHGVATRQTPAYLAEVKQRDDLFKRLVLGPAGQVFDPDWGSGAVKFAKGGWVPEPKAGEAFSFGEPFGAGGTGVSVAASAAPKSLETAIDLAFGALLEEQAAAGAALTEEQASAFEAAVRYLAGPTDSSAFDPKDSDDQFAKALESELAPLLPEATTEAMGIDDVFKGIGKALKKASDRVQDSGSDALLKNIRKPLSNQVALFLGDIFVYLRWREADGASGTYNRIFKPIVADLAKANALRKDGDPLIVVSHSLGAVILYDLLTDAKALADIQAQSGKPLQIDAWVTVGAQPGLFADMGLYSGAPGADGRLPRPPCAKRWMNVYDFTDVLSFRTEPFFADVDDFEFNNVTGALEAHTAYFRRPSFYTRLRARLDKP